jgi:hypothetical protein
LEGAWTHWLLRWLLLHVIHDATPYEPEFVCL